MIVAPEDKDNEITKQNIYHVFKELVNHAYVLQSPSGMYPSLWGQISNTEICLRKYRVDLGVRK